MSVVSIPRGEWRNFLFSYCRQHEGWLTSFAAPDDPVGKPLRLSNIRLESTDAHDRIVISFEADHGQVEHSIPHPRAIAAVRSEEGADAGLDIRSEDGDVTSLRFRSAALPESLDGIAPGERSSPDKRAA